MRRAYQINGVSAVQVDVFDTGNRPRENSHHGQRAERGRLAGGNGTLRFIRDWI